MEAFLGVFTGALIPALLGWYALYRENERIQFRRDNFDRINSLLNSAEGLVERALKAHRWDGEYLAGRAVWLGGSYTERIDQYFDSAERTALRKFASDLAATIRAITSAGSRDVKTALYDEWKTNEVEQLRVLRRAAYQASRPGVRSLFSKHY